MGRVKFDKAFPDRVEHIYTVPPGKTSRVVVQEHRHPAIKTLVVRWAVGIEHLVEADGRSGWVHEKGTARSFEADGERAFKYAEEKFKQIQEEMIASRD